jgi:zinc transporter ZupT
MFTFSAIVIIAIVTLIGGLLPIYRHASAGFYRWSEAAVSGLFIGAGLFHLLPDASHSFEYLYPQVTFPLAYVLCGIGFAGLVALEFGINHLQQHTQRCQSRPQNHIMTASLCPHTSSSEPRSADYFLGSMVIVALSVHSMIGGLAIGLNQRLSDAIIIFIIILLHKATDSFALVINLRHANFSKTAMVVIVGIFAWVTPIGMMTAHWLTAHLSARTLLEYEAVSNAIAASLFLYIGTLEGVGRQLLFARKPLPSALALMFSGLAVMGLLALWM